MRWIGFVVLGGTACSADPSYDTASLGFSPLPFLEKQPAVGCAASERDPHLVVVVVDAEGHARLAVETDDLVVPGAAIEGDRSVGVDATAHVESGPDWPLLCPGVEPAWGGPGEARAWRAVTGTVEVSLVPDPGDRTLLVGSIALTSASFEEENGSIPFDLPAVDLTPVDVYAE